MSILSVEYRAAPDTGQSGSGSFLTGKTVYPALASKTDFRLYMMIMMMMSKVPKTLVLG